MNVERQSYTVECGEPILYVDNEARGRSGHMTHAMVEFAPGKLIDFNSNCSAVIHWGHSTFGFVEYRISPDGGESFGEVRVLPYSMTSLLDGVYAISVEKALATEKGEIVAICLRNDAHRLCQPWGTPMVVKSADGGETWSEPRELCPYRGRVYAAAAHGGVLYALEFCNDGEGHFCGEKPEHVYRIFQSRDGDTWEEVCVVPIPTEGRGYGAMLFDREGVLHVYAYNINDEVHMDHVMSLDCGKTWSAAEVCYLKEGIRNPQVAQLDGVFLLHGRNAAVNGFVLYTSLDGRTWDEGTYLGRVAGSCYYSNNIVLPDPEGGERLLMQYSECYGNEECVNVWHRWLRVAEK